MDPGVRKGQPSKSRLSSCAEETEHFWESKPAVIWSQGVKEQKAEERFNMCIREVFLNLRLYTKRYMYSVKLNKPGKE